MPAGEPGAATIDRGAVDTGPKSVDVATPAAGAGGNEAAKIGVDKLRALLGQSQGTAHEKLGIVAAGVPKTEQTAGMGQLSTVDRPLIMQTQPVSGEITVGQRMDSQTAMPQTGESASPFNTQARTETPGVPHDAATINQPGVQAHEATVAEPGVRYDAATTARPEDAATVQEPGVRYDAPTTARPEDAATVQEPGVRYDAPTTARPEDAATVKTPDAATVKTPDAATVRTPDAPTVHQAEATVPQSEQNKSAENQAEKEKTMQARRDEVVAAIARLNPDFKPSDPKYQEILDEAVNDPDKMAMLETTVEACTPNAATVEANAEKFGLSSALAGKIESAGELMKLMEYINEQQKGVDGKTDEASKKVSEKMQWWKKLLLLIAGVVLAGTAGALLLTSGGLNSMAGAAGARQG